MERPSLSLHQRSLKGSLPIKKRRLALEIEVPLHHNSDDKIATLLVPSSSFFAQRTCTLADILTNRNSLCQGSSHTTTIHGKLPTSTPFSRHKVASHDKRYTAAANQVRCQATTTRGRACAFCAVRDTHYCGVHTKVQQEDGATVSTAASTSSYERAATLLSMIATDQWFGRTVQMTSGPKKDQVGTVESWGNGWVRVKLDKGTWHNRRAFELLLLPVPLDTSNCAGLKTPRPQDELDWIPTVTPGTPRPRVNCFSDDFACLDGPRRPTLLEPSSCKKQRKRV
jgi:hypothetical protein